MPGSNYIDWDSIANPNRLSQTVERESLQDCFFSPFFRENYVRATGKQKTIPAVGDVGSVGGGRPNAKFSGAPIEAWTDLQRGGTEVDMPVKLRFIQDPTSGLAPMQGTGEGVRWLWRKGYVHNYKKVAALMNDVDAQRVNEAMERAVNDEAKPALVQWKRDWSDLDIQHTFLTGFSANLTELRAIEECRDLTAYSNPNFFIAGAGQIPYSTGDRPGTAAFEDKVYNGLVTMYGTPTANVKMTAARFRMLRHLAQRKNVMPIMYNGKKFYPAIMKDSAFNQLTEDPEYRNEAMNALPGNYDSNPLFSGVHEVYNGMLIYVANNMMGVRVANGAVQRYTTGNGLPYYGPTQWLGTLANADYGDTSDIALTWVIGANTMAKLLGKKRMDWTFEDWDHGQRAEIGMKDWYSYVRTDVWDQDGELGFGENVFGYYDGGIVLATKTPYELAL